MKPYMQTAYSFLKERQSEIWPWIPSFSPAKEIDCGPDIFTDYSNVPTTNNTPVTRSYTPFYCCLIVLILSLGHSLDRKGKVFKKNQDNLKI